MKTLIDLRIGETAVVQRMDGGLRMQQQLKNLGFHEGVRITLVKRSAVGGPLMVAINGSNVAVGRGVAARIQVTAGDSKAEGPGEQNSTDGATQ